MRSALLDGMLELVPSIKRLPTTDRPRERLLRAGREALSEVELVALVLGGDLICAGTIVATFGGARGLGRALVGELLALRGIGPARACQIVAAIELGRRAIAHDPTTAVPTGWSTSQEVAAFLSDMRSLEQEELHVVGLDTRNRPQLRFVAARGSLNVVHVSAREVFRRLVREGAAATIIAHNHPSGDPAPSDDDRELTHRLRAAGDLVGVPVIDHLVIGASDHYSFADGEARARRR